MRRRTCSRRLKFGTNPDHDTDPWFFVGISTIRGYCRKQDLQNQLQFAAEMRGYVSADRYFADIHNSHVGLYTDRIRILCHGYSTDMHYAFIFFKFYFIYIVYIRHRQGTNCKLSSYRVSSYRLIEGVDPSISGVFGAY